MSDAEKIVEQTLTVMEKAKRCMAKPFDTALTAEFERAAAVLDEMDTAAALTTLVRYYEARIAKMEVESGRYSIIKDAVREVLREERDGDHVC